MQGIFHLEQTLRLFLSDTHDGDTGPHRNDLGDLLFTDCGFVGATLTMPTRLQLGNTIAQLHFAVTKFGSQLVLLLLNGSFFFAQHRLQSLLGLFEVKGRE